MTNSNNPLKNPAPTQSAQPAPAKYWAQPNSSQQENRIHSFNYDHAHSKCHCHFRGPLEDIDENDVNQDQESQDETDMLSPACPVRRSLSMVVPSDPTSKVKSETQEDLNDGTELDLECQFKEMKHIAAPRNQVPIAKVAPPLPNAAKSQRSARAAVPSNTQGSQPEVPIDNDDKPTSE